jgi:predicted transcriptional regulator
MARTPAPKRKAADKPAVTAVLLRLPSELVTELDAIATKESRTRAKQMEVALRQFAQSYRGRAAA